MKGIVLHFVGACLCVSLAVSSFAGSDATKDNNPVLHPQLDGQLEALKIGVSRLGKDLILLEEELLYPPREKLEVFLSMDVGEHFELESVQLNIDNKPASSTSYTPGESGALARGGIKRLYIGKLSPGRHRITATCTGVASSGLDYERKASISIEHIDEPTLVELRILDSVFIRQPELGKGRSGQETKTGARLIHVDGSAPAILKFSVKQWEQ